MKKIFKNMNPFVFNGGIGRIALLLTLLGTFVLVFVLLLFPVLMVDKFPPDLLGVRIYNTLCLCLLLYLSSLAYMKRLNDIINDKKKSVFYIIASYIGVICLEFLSISVFGIGLDKILSVCVIALLLLVPGRNKESC